MTETVIVAGWLLVAAADRAAYLAATADVAALARAAPGCRDFVQVADPVEPDRVVIYERWDSAAELEAFRTSGDPDAPPVATPPVLGAEVRRYVVARVEDP